MCATQFRAKTTYMPHIHAAYVVMQIRKVNREKGYWQGLVFFIDFCVVAVKTSMDLVRFPIRLTEIRLVLNYFLLEYFSFLGCLRFHMQYPNKSSLKLVRSFPHFRCQFASFFFVVSVPTTTAPILMSTLARRRECARIFSKGSAHEDSKYVS